MMMMTMMMMMMIIVMMNMLLGLSRSELFGVAAMFRNELTGETTAPRA